METEEFEVTSFGSKALLKPSETLLLSYYENLVDDNVVKENYPTTTASKTDRISNDSSRGRSYEYPAWSSYSDPEAPFHDEDSTCCNFCAMILGPRAIAISCDGCSQMTYCSEKCKTNHASEGHDFTFCTIMQRMEGNCVTKGELLSLIEKVPKEEDYELPVFTGDSVFTASEINETTRKSMKDERKFVRRMDVDFSKLMHETIRVECATCGGNKYDSDEDENYSSSSSESNSSEKTDEYASVGSKHANEEKEGKGENYVGNLIIECNSFSKSSAIFPKFEKLPPLDKKTVVIANSYLNSLGYDDEVDVRIFDCQKISESLFDLYDSSIESEPCDNDDRTGESSTEHQKQVGAFLNLGFGPYPYRRRRRYYPGPAYYGRPYGWRYGRRYRPRVGPYGYYGGPRLNYYVGTCAGRWTEGIGNVIGALVCSDVAYDRNELESSILIRGKSTEAALQYLRRRIRRKPSSISPHSKGRTQSDSFSSSSIAFSVALIPVHVKPSKLSYKFESLDVENVPTKRTSIAFLNKTTGTKGSQPLPVGRYSIERMMGLHGLLLKLFDFYRRKTPDNVLEMPEETQYDVWSKYDNFSITFVNADDGDYESKKTNFSGHFPLDPAYFGKPRSVGKKKSIVRSKSEKYSNAQRLILAYLMQNGFVSLSSYDPASVSYKKLSKLPFKNWLFGRVNPESVFAFPDRPFDSPTLTFEDIFATSKIAEGHFKISISNNRTSSEYVHSTSADAMLNSINDVLSRAIFVFDPTMVPEAKEDMPPSFAENEYVDVTNAQIKIATEKQGLPLMVVAHEAIEIGDDKKGTVGLMFMFFEWIETTSSTTTTTVNAATGHHVLSQFVYCMHDKNMAYKYFSSK
jgi:hypothetical protein